MDDKYYFVFSETDCRSVLLSKIPFTHPSQLLTIFNLLRQQIVFNELLLSCTNDPMRSLNLIFSFRSMINICIDSVMINKYVVKEEEEFQEEKRVFEVVCNVPTSIEVTFTDMKNLLLVRIEIEIGLGGIISAVQYPESPHYSNLYLTSLLQNSLHIPLTLYNIFQKIK